MSKSQINLQDAFLNHVRKEKIQVTINLAGGGSVEGLVKGFDNFVILVKHEGQHLIYKHAINSIVPERPVELSSNTQQARQPEPAPEPKAEPAPEPKPKPEPKAKETTVREPADLGPETTAPEPAEDEEPWVEG